MKLFKRIYYPVLSALLVLMLVFAILDATNGYSTTKLDLTEGMEIAETVGNAPHSVDDKTAKDAVKDYITGKLTGYGMKKVEDDKDSAGKNDPEYPGNARQSVFVVQEAELQFSDVKSFYDINSLGAPVVRDYKVNNIIVSIPGTRSKAGQSYDTVLFTCHYDSFFNTAGATETGVPVAAMLLNIEDALKNEYEHDLVFLFADYGNVDNLGVYAFSEYFIGFNRLSQTVDLAVSFDYFGTGGTLALVKTNNTDYDFLKSYAKLNNSTYVNTQLDGIYDDVFTGSDVYARRIPTVSFASIGRGENYRTANDTVKNISKSLLGQTAGVISSMANEYGNTGAGGLAGETEGVAFTYLNMFTVSVPSYVPYIFGAVMILLLGAIIGLNFKFKNYSFRNTLLGALIALLGAVGALAAIYVAYYLVGSIAAGFSIVTFRGLPYITFSNAGLIIGAMLVAVAASIGCYTFFKWLFKIKAKEVVNGNILLVALAGIILSFAVPKMSVIFGGLALIELVIVLLTNIFRDRFKEKSGMDIDRLFLPVAGMILAAPLAITGMVMYATVYGAAMYPLIISLFALFSGMIAPYFTFLNPVFQRVAEKLPMRKIRKYEVVTEEVPHPTKKNKTVEQKVKRNFEEKAPRKYTSAFGISVVAIVAVLVLIFTGFFGSNISKNLTYAHGEVDVVYDDTLVFEASGTSGSTNPTSGRWVIQDRDAYKYLVFTGFEYDTARGAFVCDDNDNLKSASMATISSSSSGSSKTVTIRPAHDIGRFTFTITGATSITKITVAGSEASYEKQFSNQSSITITASGSTTLTIDGASAVSYSYKEVSRGQAVFNAFTASMKANLAGKNVAYVLTCEGSV